MGVELTDNQYDRIFRQALRIRMVEEKITEIYPSDKIQSPVHLSVGQEHHIAAAMSILGERDSVFSSYRCHAVYLAKGGSMRKMFAELYGKRGGASAGKAGSMHLCDAEVRMYGSSAIVGAVIPHAIGVAYSYRLRNDPSITVSVTGDGSAEEGVFHECLNFAALKGLPILFLIENNGLAIHAPLAERQSFRLRDLVRSYGIPYVHADNGMDMAAVARMSSQVAENIRKGDGPALMEIATFRYLEHVGIRADFDKGYRSLRECEEWKKKDPLILDRERVARHRPAIEAEIADAVEFAEKSEFPGQGDLLKDVI